MINIYDLPKEIIGRILNTAFVAGIEISQFIFSCKYFYYNYRHLIYITKDCNIEEHNHLFKKYRNRTKLIDLIESDTELSKNIYILNIHSNLSSFLNNKKCKILEFLPNNLKDFNNLIVLNISLNSIELILNLFRILPKRLKVLIMRLEIKKVQFLKFNKKLINTKKSISYLPELKYFELISHNYDLLFNHIHPEFSRFDYSFLIPEEISFQNNLETMNMKLFEKYKNNTNEFKWKLEFSLILNRFTKINYRNLIKIEILGIDLNLIFNNASIFFPNLRLLSFDNTSRINLTKWINEFQQENRFKSYKDKFPLLICHDRAGRRLYYKTADVIRNQEGISEIESWNYESNACKGYIKFNKEFDLEY